MRVGVIDLGTNSVRFAIYQGGGAAPYVCVYKKKMMLRPGQGVFTDGHLRPAAMKKISSAFNKFSRRAKKEKVELIRAVATSALREAKNSRELVSLVRRKTGIKIEVISGRQEARLIAKGILTHETPRSGLVALIDIGGGSTEISICRGRRVLHSVSLDIGALRVQQIFLDEETQRHQALRLAGVDQMRKAIQIELRLHARRFADVGAQTVFGSSGTIRALARMLDRRHAARLRQAHPPPSSSKPRLRFGKKHLKELLEKMLAISRAELKRIPGMEQRRADIILGGAILLYEILDHMGAAQVLTTNYSLRDGILEEFNLRR